MEHRRICAWLDRAYDNIACVTGSKYTFVALFMIHSSSICYQTALTLANQPGAQTIQFAFTNSF